MEKLYNLVSVKIKEKDENMVDLEYYTADGKQQIVSMCVHKSVLPPMSDTEEVTQDEHTALLQLLLTPYGHLNLLERWLNWASNNVNSPSVVVDVTGRKKPEDAVLGLIQDTKRLLGIDN